MSKEEKKCEVCGRSFHEYDPTWPCKKNHTWLMAWRKDKNSKKYKLYIKRKKKAQLEIHRKKLDALNKKPPIEYLRRKKGSSKSWKPESEA